MSNLALDRWLQYAPTPALLSIGKRYCVFISYRSVNGGALVDLRRVTGFAAGTTMLDLAPGERAPCR